jgi:hypothetical protein
MPGEKFVMLVWEGRQTRVHDLRPKRELKSKPWTPKRWRPAKVRKQNAEVEEVSRGLSPSEKCPHGVFDPDGARRYCSVCNNPPINLSGPSSRPENGQIEPQDHDQLGESKIEPMESDWADALDAGTRR